MRKSRISGFTMLECIVALAVFSVLMLIVLRSAFLQSTLLERANAELGREKAIAHFALDWLERSDRCLLVMGASNGMQSLFFSDRGWIPETFNERNAFPDAFAFSRQPVEGPASGEWVFHYKVGKEWIRWGTIKYSE